jgi:hypothetical protein
MAELRSLTSMLILGLAFAAACEGVTGNPSPGDAPAMRCGDERCDPGENRLICPSDCIPAGSFGGSDGDEDSLTGHGGEGAAPTRSPGGYAGRAGAGSGGGGGTPASSSGGQASGSGGQAGESDAGAAGAAEIPLDRGIGARCSRASDCDDGLECMASDLFDGAGPAGGICTHVCEADSDCETFSPGSICMGLTADASYCFEGCTTGITPSPKCHGRGELACSLAGLTPAGGACSDFMDCGPRQVCATTNTCSDGRFACWPVCGSDANCGSGKFCDLVSGFCFTQPFPGLPVGSPCTPPSPGELDPCNGFCDTVTSDAYVCTALCTFGAPGCGWSGEGPADAACLFASYLTPIDEDPTGDEGHCGKLCDCNADCPVAGDSCVDDTDGPTELFGRKGYCRPLQPGEDANISFPDCTSTASGASSIP